MSPVAAVTLMCARLTGTQPADLVKRVAVPILAGVSVAIVVVLLWAYYAANIFLFGAHFARAYAERFGTLRPHPEATE